MEAPQHYIACLRIVAKPTRAKRAVSRIIPHPESCKLSVNGGIVADEDPER
jgi:hypothetical protein